MNEKQTFTAYIEKDGDTWLATIAYLSRISSFGDTIEEAIEHIKEAAELYCERKVSIEVVISKG